jgi:oligopeptide transport system permease protein
MIFISVPSFIVITLLVMWFGYDLKLLPTSWPSSSYPTAVKAAGFVIPVIALSFGSICGYCRFTRAELCEVLSSDYLLLARTKGLTKRQAVMRHALRNAMVPILPSILAEIVGVLSGSMILETLYAIPGIGKLFYDAISEKDFNVLMVDMALFTTIGLVAGIVLDLSYGFLDPRIRMGEKK